LGELSIEEARTGSRNDVPFAPQVYDVRIHASGNLDVHANVHAGKRVEAAERIRMNDVIPQRLSEIREQKDGDK
jgi:hydroxyacyl-ACP dehydratase HTD2-like protein with hotdog domain